MSWARVQGLGTHVSLLVALYMYKFIVLEGITWDLNPNPGF